MWQNPIGHQVDDTVKYMYMCVKFSLHANLVKQKTVVGYGEYFHGGKFGHLLNFEPNSLM